MNHKFPIIPDSLEPSLSAAITFGSSSLVFLILSFITGRILFSFLFSVLLLLCIWEIRELLYRRKERGHLSAQKCSEAEHQTLGITYPRNKNSRRMQKAVGVFLFIIINVIMLYSFTTDSAELSAIFGAATPLIMILLDYNAVRFTWQEIKLQKFRLAVYALSLLLFLYPLLTTLGILSIQDLVPEQIWFKVNLLLRLAFAPLLLATIYFIIRDTWRRMYNRPL